MAVIEAHTAVSIYNFNLYNYYSYATNDVLRQAGYNISLADGSSVFYDDRYTVFSSSGLAQFFGNGLAYDAAGDLTIGWVSGIVDKYWDGIRYVSTFTVHDAIPVAAADVWAAAQTVGNADDLALMAAALAGNDTFYLSDGADEMNGYAGNDVMYGGLRGDVLDGGAGKDILNGENGNDFLIGGTGNDILRGGQGNDVLLGGVGHDKMFGGAGIDEFVMDAGNDLIDGGAGMDILFLGENASAGSVNLNLTGAQDTGHGMDTVRNIEVIIGTRQGDTLIGDNNDNLFWDWAGADKLSGKGGDDIIFAANGRDRVFGGNGADILVGGGGNDRIFGGKGADLITGDGGQDKLYAGVDNVQDTFLYDYAGESPVGAGNFDMIFDFDRGEDKIAFFQGFGANTWSGTSVAANSVWYLDLGVDVVLYADTTGDAIPDFEVEVMGVGRLGAADIHFGFTEDDIDLTPYSDSMVDYAL